MKDFEVQRDTIKNSGCLVKVTEEFHDYFLEVLPPIYSKGEHFGFFNSEPLSHDIEGNPVYYAFCCELVNGENIFWGFISSKKSFDFLVENSRRLELNIKYD